MTPRLDETPPHLVIAWAGWTLIVVGLVGLIVSPRLLPVWLFIMFFGIAALPQAIIEWWRSRH